MQSLFSDPFLASIDRLSLDIRPAPPRVNQGTQLSPRAGASLEFRDYQGYTPGDDLRRVDWSVYARTKHLFVRRFEHPTAVPVFMLIDGSESMRLETPSRYVTAARVAASIASAGLASQNPIYLAVSGDKAFPRVTTQRRGLFRLLSDLAADRPASSVGLAASVHALLPLLAGKGRGVFVVVSDFFEQQGLDELLAILGKIPQRLVLVRVTQPADAVPELSGDVELIDCESRSSLHVSIGPDARHRYRDAYTAYFGRLDAFIVSRGAASATVDAAGETLPQLERLFPSGVMRL